MDLYHKEMGLIGLHFWSFHDIKQNGIRVVDWSVVFKVLASS